jgi:hypothetical protein
MCDLAYVNLLREKVRWLEVEEKRHAAFHRSSSERFVPWVLPVQLPLQGAPEPTRTE